MKKTIAMSGDKEQVIVTYSLFGIVVYTKTIDYWAIQNAGVQA